MQSDGKSSFIEGLLGFQFNVVDTNIGTRRPLIIQMINNPDRDTPYCKFRKENPLESEDPFEDRETPVSYLSEEIIRRTDAKTNGDKNRVCPIPIILRVEYRYSANLTIYDTPGFRLQGNERLKREIEEMNKAIMAPKHRILVCLEQSTVEWSNTVSRPIVRRVDPNFERTILVNTKFDNRVKELRDAECADRYLEGEGDVTLAKEIFFISMPVRRNLDPDRFKDAMKDAYISDYRNLLNIRFDEGKYAARLGIFRLRRHLQRLLHEQYKRSLSPTLSLLEEKVVDTERQLEAVRHALKEANLEEQKSKVNLFVGSFVLLIEKLLLGTVCGDPDSYGETLEEEKVNSGVGEWPGFSFDYPIQNATFKVYGGSQYERLLNEFEYVSHSMEFPPTSIHEVASTLGTSKSHNVPNFEAAASDIVTNKSKKIFLPLIDIILKRCSYIFSRLFDIAVEVIIRESGLSFGMIGQYEGFRKTLETVFTTFIKQPGRKCEEKLRDDFITFTTIIDWDVNRTMAECGTQYPLLDVKKEDTMKRVMEIMHPKEESVVEGWERGRAVNEKIYKEVLLMSAKLFSSIRFGFTKYTKSKFNAFFLDPMFQGLGSYLTDHFRKMDDETYERMFDMGLKQLEEKADKLEVQLEKFKENRDHFQTVLRSFKQRV